MYKSHGSVVVVKNAFEWEQMYLHGKYSYYKNRYSSNTLESIVCERCRNWNDVHDNQFEQFHVELGNVNKNVWICGVCAGYMNRAMTNSTHEETTLRELLRLPRSQRFHGRATLNQRMAILKRPRDEGYAYRTTLVPVVCHDVTIQPGHKTPVTWHPYYGPTTAPC